MPTQTTITLDSPFVDASYGPAARVLSTNELKELFLWGIPLANSATGATLPDTTIEQKLKAMQSYAGRIFDIRIGYEYAAESHDFSEEEYRNWAYIKANFNIARVLNLTGRLSGQTIMTYPIEWLTTQTSLIENFRNVNLVPNGNGSVVTLDMLAMVNNQWFSIFGNKHIPNFFYLEYITGFSVVPDDLINFIGKMACIELLPMLEFVVSGSGNNVGNMFGAASVSLGLDGLSQSVSKANGGNIFQARIKQYASEVQAIATTLTAAFKGIGFDVA